MGGWGVEDDYFGLIGLRNADSGASNFSMIYAKTLSATAVQSATWTTAQTDGDEVAIQIVTLKIAAVGGATPKGPFGHPFYGPFGGPF